MVDDRLVDRKEALPEEIAHAVSVVLAPTATVADFDVPEQPEVPLPAMDHVGHVAPAKVLPSVLPTAPVRKVLAAEAIPASATDAVVEIATVTVAR